MRLLGRVLLIIAQCRTWWRDKMMSSFIRKNGLVLLLVAALIGSYIFGQRQAQDRERAFLAQMRMLQEQQVKDRQTFLEAVRGLRSGSQPINITLPTLGSIPGTVTPIAESPRTIRIEIEAKAPITPAEAQKRVEAGARRVKIRIQPKDLRSLPPEQREALIVEDLTTGAFACVTGSLCEGERGPFTEVTIPKFDLPKETFRSRTKLVAGFPAGVGLGYEVYRFDLPIVGQGAVDVLAFAWPKLSAGLGASKRVAPTIDLGLGFTAGQYTGAVLYMGWHLP